MTPNTYDAMAPDFDRHRRLPDGVAAAARAAVLQAVPSPRILDLGAGSGRIGRCFACAGDDYTGVDLSFGMLREFAGRTSRVCLVQADGARLPFADATFDAVLLIQVLSGARNGRPLLTDATRVLRRTGALVIGRVIAPPDGIDAQMKSRLAEILAGMDVHPYRDKPRDDALAWLACQLPNPEVLTVASWTAERSTGAFLERHAAGARFSLLAEPVRHAAMQQLTEWASGRFGSPDTAFPEQHSFELIIHRFQQGITT